MIRTLWVYWVGIAATVFYGSRVIVYSILNLPSFRRIADSAPADWSGRILWAANVKTVLENAEFLDDRPQILVANHQSWFDVFALSVALPLNYRFVAKQELASIPVFGSAWQRAGHYGIDRSDRQAAIGSLKKVAEQLKAEGHTVVLFPEGTRSPTGELASFKKGAFVLAINGQVPIVPVAVLGTREIMPKGSWSVRPGTVTVRVGRPIETTGMEMADRDRLMGMARDAIAGLMEGDADGSRSGPPEEDQVGTDPTEERIRHSG